MPDTQQHSLPSEEDAIRAYCTAADERPTCAFPLCHCIAIPAGVRAVLALLSVQAPAGSEVTRHLWPRQGDWMRFLGQNGYEHELAAAMQVFKVGHEYEVVDCEVGSWHHSVAFVGIPGRFNGVMFEATHTGGE